MLNIVPFQVFCQGFYIDFWLLLLLYFRFPIACIFQSNPFSHIFMVAGLSTTRQLTRWQTVVLVILFTFLGCLRLPESLIKIWGIMLMGKISPQPNTLRSVCSRLGPWNLTQFSFFMKHSSSIVFKVAFKWKFFSSSSFYDNICKTEAWYFGGNIKVLLGDLYTRWTSDGMGITWRLTKW